jgi:uncharacterized protein (TIGR02466 family)
MTQPQIHKWFPKSIYVIDDQLLNYLLAFEGRIQELFKNTGASSNGMLSVDSTHKTDDQLHLDPVFESLNNIIYEHAYNFLVTLGYSNEFIDTLDITNMWANISHKDDFIFPHVHSDSVLSGAFYIKKYEGSKIKFFNDVTSMMPKPNTFNELNYEYCDYDCNPGRMILFKSDFLHGTERQTDGEKIVISFNLGKQHG